MGRNTVISKRLLACSSLLGCLDQKEETENDTVISNFPTYSHNCTEIVLLEPFCSLFFRLQCSSFVNELCASWNSKHALGCLLLKLSNAFELTLCLHAKMLSFMQS